MTGAATGIGAATVTRFEAEGAHVVGVDADPAYDGVVADVTDPDQMAAAVRAAGELDICVANAGISLMQPFLEGDLQLLGAGAAGEPARRDEHVPAGCACDAARRAAPCDRLVAGLRGEPDASAYCASKAGVIGLVRSLAIELGADGLDG